MNKLTNVSIASLKEFSPNTQETAGSLSGRVKTTMTYENLDKPCPFECRFMTYQCPNHNHISPPSCLEITGFYEHFEVFLRYVSTSDVLMNTIKTLVIRNVHAAQIDLFSSLVAKLPCVEALYIKKCLIDDERVAEAIKGMKNCKTLIIQKPYCSVDNIISDSVMSTSGSSDCSYTEEKNPITTESATSRIEELVAYIKLERIRTACEERTLLLMLCIQSYLFKYSY